jgi:hypothetical protein
VYRLALGLLAVSGCDTAVGLEHITVKPGACGPYSKVTPVQINGVDEAKGFSISADETMAMVTGKDAGGMTHPTILKLDGDAWTPDAAFQGNLASFNLVAANLAPFEPAPNGSLYQGVDRPALLGATHTNMTTLSRYFWSGTGWGVDINQPEIAVSNIDVHPGNMWVHVDAGLEQTNRVRVATLLMTPQDVNEGPTVIKIYANTLPSFTLMDRTRTATFDGLGLQLGQAVMTEDRTKLVYAATGGSSDIFAVDQDPVSKEFDKAGGGVTGVNTPDDEVEPWINSACTKLWFRRVPAGMSNEAGQIYVAEQQ